MFTAPTAIRVIRSEVSISSGPGLFLVFRTGLPWGRGGQGGGGGVVLWGREGLLFVIRAVSTFLNLKVWVSWSGRSSSHWYNDSRQGPRSSREDTDSRVAGLGRVAGEWGGSSECSRGNTVWPILVCFIICAWRTGEARLPSYKGVFTVWYYEGVE